ADGMGAGGHCGFPFRRSSSTHARPRVSATNRKVSNGAAGEVSRRASSRSNSRDRMWSSREPTSFQISTYRVSSGRPTCWKTPPPPQPGRARVTSESACSARAVSASCPEGRVMSRMVITSCGTGSFIEGEDALPVVLHADHGPPLLLRLVVERLREGTDLRVGEAL